MWVSERRSALLQLAPIYRAITHTKQTKSALIPTPNMDAVALFGFVKRLKQTLGCVGDAFCYSESIRGNPNRVAIPASMMTALLNPFPATVEDTRRALQAGKIAVHVTHDESRPNTYLVSIGIDRTVLELGVASDTVTKGELYTTAEAMFNYDAHLHVGTNRPLGAGPGRSTCLVHGHQPSIIGYIVRETPSVLRAAIDTRFFMYCKAWAYVSPKTDAITITPMHIERLNEHGVLRTFAWDNFTVGIRSAHQDVKCLIGPEIAMGVRIVLMQQMGHDDLVAFVTDFPQLKKAEEGARSPNAVVHVFGLLTLIQKDTDGLYRTFGRYKEDGSMNMRYSCAAGRADEQLIKSVDDKTFRCSIQNQAGTSPDADTMFSITYMQRSDDLLAGHVVDRANTTLPDQVPYCDIICDASYLAGSDFEGVYQDLETTLKLQKALPANPNPKFIFLGDVMDHAAREQEGDAVENVVRSQLDTIRGVTEHAEIRLAGNRDLNKLRILYPSVQPYAAGAQEGGFLDLLEMQGDTRYEKTDVEEAKVYANTMGIDFTDEFVATVSHPTYADTMRAYLAYADMLHVNGNLVFAHGTGVVDVANGGVVAKGQLVVQSPTQSYVPTGVMTVREAGVDAKCVDFQLKSVGDLNALASAWNAVLQPLRSSEKIVDKRVVEMLSLLGGPGNVGFGCVMGGPSLATFPAVTHQFASYTTITAATATTLGTRGRGYEACALRDGLPIAFTFLARKNGVGRLARSKLHTFEVRQGDDRTYIMTWPAWPAPCNGTVRMSQADVETLYAGVLSTGNAVGVLGRRITIQTIELSPPH